MFTIADYRIGFPDYCLKVFKWSTSAKKELVEFVFYDASKFSLKLIYYIQFVWEKHGILEALLKFLKRIYSENETYNAHVIIICNDRELFVDNGL